MVEVDPTLIFAAAVTIVGIAAVAICSKPKEDAPSKKKEKAVISQSATPSLSQSKPKKKARSKAKSKSKSENAEQVDAKVDTQSSPKASTDHTQSKDSTHVRFDDAEKQPKKKNKQKALSIPTSKKPVVFIAESVDEENSSDSDSSDDDDAAIISIDIPKRPASPLLEIIVSPPSPTASFTHTDGWAVVEDKRKIKVKKPDSVEEPTSKPVVEESPTAFVAPIIESVTSEIRVDAKKLGLLIGSKGATRNAIQNATGTSIQMPKAEKDTVGTVAVTVTGTAAGVNKAITAMNELCIKGYCALLAADDFQESYVAVHSKYVSEIIGKGGSTIKALSAHTGVKITIPTVSKTLNADGKASKVKVGLAGPKEKVAVARNLIKDITKYFHTPVTHPNLTHDEMTIAENYFNFIIGAKGSEIKHIQNSYKVSVHIPDEDSSNSNVVIVGSEAGVSQARHHIEKIIDRVNGVADKAVSESIPNLEPSSIGLSSSAASSEHQDPVGGSWVSESPSKANVHAESAPITTSSADEASWYTATASSTPVDLSRVLPTNTKFTSLPISVSGPVDSKPLASSAWNNISSLANDKW